MQPCHSRRPRRAAAPVRDVARPARPCGAVRGFSLIELLIATSIGAGLMVSLAAMAHLCTAQVAEAEGGDLRMEQAVATLSQGVRTAWAVSGPSADQLQLHDPFGRVTEYFVEDHALKVLRPSGAEGTLLPDVASVSFDLRTTARLRESTPQTAVQTFWTSPANTGTASMLTLTSGQSLALGFIMPVAAQSSFNHVGGVTEQVRSTTPTRLLLPVAWLDASNKSFCHLHAKQPHSPNHSSGAGTLSIELYEARVPGDARPLGSRLGTVTVTTGTLPTCAYQWWDTKTNQAASPPAGVAWGWWDGHPEVVLKVNTAPSQAAISIAGLSATLLPGRAYTLVLTLNGWDEISVQTRPLSSSRLSGVALKTSSGASWSPQATTVTCSLEGNQTITQTTATAVVTGVTMNVQMQDGRSATGAANVAGQLAVDDPWLGALPGELPMLTLAGS